MKPSLPYTLSHPLEEARKNLDAGSWFRAMNYLLDFLETGAAYTSVVLLAMFRREVLRDGTPPAGGVLQAVRKIDAKRPLSFGDWVNDILAPLAVDAAKRFPDNAFAHSIGEVAGRRKNIFLPSNGESGVVQIRNRYKGHGTTLSDSHYQEVCAQLSGRAEQFAAALDAIGACGVDLEKDLYPLVHRSEQGYEYVFQTLNDELAAFVSTDENALSIATAELNPAFDAWMQVLLPSFDIAKDLNWSELVDAMQEASRAYMADIYSQKKYNREQFVERDALSKAYQDFLDSDRIIFPLPGEAGQGKTNQLCHWTETLSEQGEGVLIFAGAGFADINLEESLRQVFHLSPRKKIDAYIERINTLARQAGKKVYIFFDAVNETIAYPGITEGMSGPLMLYRDIYRLFGRRELDCVRLLFTCRNYTWVNELVPEQAHQDPAVFFSPGDEGGASVRGFTDSEVRKAYAVYGELFQMETPFDNLKRGCVLRLKDPLMLKIACTNYLGKELPESHGEYSSLSLFARMLDDIAHSYAGRGQIKILQEIARYMLDKYAGGEPVDSIMMDDLKAALDDPSAPLHKAATLMFKRDGITVAFAELLNRPERPVLRMVKQTKVQFIYERFLEYLLSRAYIDASDNVTADMIYHSIKAGAANEVFMGAMRNVLLIDYLRDGVPDTAVDLLLRYGQDFEIFSLVSGMMDVMVRELYSKELFDLERRLLHWRSEGLEATVAEFNRVCRAIDSNKATDETISRHKELSERLTPMIRLRNLAGASLIGGILLSDAHNEGLYEEDPYSLLWTLMDDPVTEVRNNACMQAYYVSKRTLTLNYEPLNENITQQIVRRMFDYIRDRSLLALTARKRARNRTVTLLEAGVRLDVILIIDLLLDGREEDRARVSDLLDEIRGLFRHMTLNYALVRILMPFFAWILRRQMTFQSAYVNNITEYSTFWKNEVVAPAPTPDGRWNRRDVSDIAPMAFLYSRYMGENASRKGEPAPSIEPFRERIVQAYKTGDSLSYFLLERLLVIFGLSDWEHTLPILADIDRTVPGTPWADYSQMSFIYILYQLGLKLETLPAEVEEMLEHNCADWTRRCRGYFKAHNVDKANPLQLYKRNVMSWYAMVWCRRHGDHPDPEGKSVPLFRQMLAEAVQTRDKELLIHLVNNIAELVTDSGDIHTALDLLRIIFEQIPSQAVLDEFEANAPNRYPDTALDLVSLVGNILGTAKNYFPGEVNDFLTRGVIGLHFPGIPKYKDDILSYNPSGENLADLLTHKFGNFIIWALIHEEGVDAVVSDCLKEASTTSDSAAWFDRCVRIVLRSLLKIRI